MTRNKNKSSVLQAPGSKHTSAVRYQLLSDQNTHLAAVLHFFFSKQVKLSDWTDHVHTQSVCRMISSQSRGLYFLAQKGKKKEYHVSSKSYWTGGFVQSYSTESQAASERWTAQNKHMAMHVRPESGKQDSANAIKTGRGMQSCQLVWLDSASVNNSSSKV